MEDSDFDVNVKLSALKNNTPRQMREEYLKQIREALQMPRAEIMSLTLRSLTMLLAGLLEDSRVQELHDQGIHLTLQEIACSKPRKQRRDKGQPRGPRAKSDEPVENETIDEHPYEDVITISDEHDVA